MLRRTDAYKRSVKSDMTNGQRVYMEGFFEKGIRFKLTVDE